MIATKLEIPEVILFEPTCYSDNRGLFYESYNKKLFDSIVGRDINFVQDNNSISAKHVLRGLHYQTAPMAQGKLVRVIRGEVFDVAVDIRKESKTFGKWVGALLSAENKKQLWIPEGFAHGFISMIDDTEVLYKINNYYSPEHERFILWNDNQLDIDWRIKDTTQVILSEKDIRKAIALDKADLF